MVFATVLLTGTAAAGQHGPNTALAALECTTSAQPLECLERTAADDYPANLRPEIARLATYALFGEPETIDPGEEAYRAFLALINAGIDFRPADGRPISHIFKAYVDRHVAARVQSMYLRAALLDLALDLLRLSTRGKEAWIAADQAVESEYQAAHPAFADRVRWKDPEVSINYIAWLAEEMTRNVEYLRAMGKEDEAQRVLFLTEDLVSPLVAGREAQALLLTNTMARFILAGWRDVDEPLKSLQHQIGTSLANVATLQEQSVPVRGVWFRGTLGAATLYQALRRGRVANLPANVFCLLLPVPGARRVAELVFPVVSRGPVMIRGTIPGRQAPAVDDLACALNLPLALAPIGTELDRFLKSHRSSFVDGNAVLLGSGDGGEARAAAWAGPFGTVLAVDHSGLAVERIGEMTRRVSRLRPLTTIAPTSADVAALSVGAGSASLVVANHLVEYLQREDRLALYEQVGEWLTPGGFFFLNVHLAQGPRFGNHCSSFDNVVCRESAAGTVATMNSLIPVARDAVQVQLFYQVEGLSEELKLANLTPANGFAIEDRVVESPSGLVELVSIIRKAN